jgi:hypothetical protein
VPGISANLTAQAYAIWETIPKKQRGNPDCPGRSAFLSRAIIEHTGWTERYRELLNEKIELEKALRVWEKAYGDS